MGVEHEVKGQGIYAFVTLNDGVPFSPDLRRDLILTVRKQVLILSLSSHDRADDDDDDDAHDINATIMMHAMIFHRDHDNVVNGDDVRDNGSHLQSWA